MRRIIVSLEELISRLQYLATFVDNPADVQVLVQSDFHEQTDNIKLVEIESFKDNIGNGSEDTVYIVI